MKPTCIKGMVGVGCALAALTAQATELVYVPINPSFGGSPLYGSVLLGSAQATSKHKEEDPSALGISGQDPLRQFNETLERAVLSQLASSATSRILVNGQLVPGAIETGNFRINVVDSGGGALTVTTTDKATGATSSFVVGK